MREPNPANRLRTTSPTHPPHTRRASCALAVCDPINCFRASFGKLAGAKLRKMSSVAAEAMARASSIAAAGAADSKWLAPTFQPPRSGEAAQAVYVSREAQQQQYREQQIPQQPDAVYAAAEQRHAHHAQQPALLLLHPPWMYRSHRQHVQPSRLP